MRLLVDGVFEVGVYRDEADDSLRRLARPSHIKSKTRDLLETSSSSNRSRAALSCESGGCHTGEIRDGSDVTPVFTSLAATIATEAV